MKFLCIECDEQMSFGERQLPGDGTLAAVFRCPACGREVAMLTNPMETQVVSSLGIEDRRTRGAGAAVRVDARYDRGRSGGCVP